MSTWHVVTGHSYKCFPLTLLYHLWVCFCMDFNDILTMQLLFYSFNVSSPLSCKYESSNMRCLVQHVIHAGELSDVQWWGKENRNKLKLAMLQPSRWRWADGPIQETESSPCVWRQRRRKDEKVGAGFCSIPWASWLHSTNKKVPCQDFFLTTSDLFY